MYPHERSLVKQLAGKPFSLIGVNSDDDIEELKEVIKEKELTWRSFQNEQGAKGSISDAWGIEGWPTVFIIDAEGVIRAVDSRDIDGEIETLLAEMGHEVEIVHDFDKDEEGDGADEESDGEESEGEESDGE